MERTQLSQSNESAGGSKDGSGAADHDEPYQFGRRPRAVAPWPFTERQYARLLVLRGRVREQADPADGKVVEVRELKKAHRRAA
ncbi:MAG: hypothetical protein M3336_15285 [Chloroflexota bacterium]|nr:hypothetical protein [Chloroflexota bacterium]